MIQEASKKVHKGPTWVNHDKNYGPKRITKTQWSEEVGPRRPEAAIGCGGYHGRGSRDSSQVLRLSSRLFSFRRSFVRLCCKFDLKGDVLG